MRFKWTVYQACWFCVLQALLACALSALPSAHGAPGFDGAVAEFKAKHYSQALSGFQAYAKANPQDVTSHYYIGLCYQYMNQVALASDQYKWIVAYSKDPKLKAQAQAGLATLNQYQSKRSYQGYTPSKSKAGSLAAKPGIVKGGRLQVMEFYTDWCGTCKKFAPVFDQVKSSFRSGDCTFQKINGDDQANSALMDRYKIAAYPTTVFADSAGTSINQFVGATDAEGFKNMVDIALQKIK